MFLGAANRDPRRWDSPDAFDLSRDPSAHVGFGMGTRRIALIQRRLARLLAPTAAVRILPCPFEAVPVNEALWWHPVHTQDAAHIWLRETAARVAADLETG
ncbi:hypothetical protein [Actinoallomurus iriomotensis]|uniref:Uncharacterized protein n=1 Tax=Actinoallomurus iriomotensis TaxID=478107 RepID=A0A9W6RJQ1_9ACTN|nr:hypothetical protein [Actinoallomurus iriomotensis]GLY75287.1 hypothetical protein Airi01_035540 [Actinoallomurus iriomotensis]